MARGHLGPGVKIILKTASPFLLQIQPSFPPGRRSLFVSLPLMIKHATVRAEREPEEIPAFVTAAVYL